MAVEDLAASPTSAMAFGEWAARLTLEQLSPATLDHAQILLLSLFESILVGSQTSWGNAARDTARQLGGQPTSTVLVFGDRIDAARAAFVNGSLAHSADIDDTDVQGMMHAGASVIPSALALGEWLDASGEDLVLALLAGYEVGIRVARAVQPSHFNRGFHATGTCGAIAAATAAARVARRSGDEIGQAISNAASFASGIGQFYYSGSTIKRVHAGRAAESGVMASLLAERGIFGAASALEGQRGFAQAFADGVDLRGAVDDLGTDRLMIEDVVTKTHATSARIQSPVEAILRLSRRVHDLADRVVAIEARVPASAIGPLTQPDPIDVSSAQMSVPFSVALALVVSEQGNGSQSGLRIVDYERHLANPDVRRLSALVSCAALKASDPLSAYDAPARVTVRLDEPVETQTETVAASPGSAEFPLSRSDHEKRFAAAAHGALPTDHVERVLEMVAQVTRTSVRELVRSMSPISHV